MSLFKDCKSCEDEFVAHPWRYREGFRIYRRQGLNQFIEWVVNTFGPWHMSDHKRHN